MKIATHKSGGVKIYSFDSEKNLDKKQIEKGAEEFADFCKKNLSESFVKKLIPTLREYFNLTEDDRVIKIKEILGIEVEE